ncbi:hypothetical protein HH214_15105 [Mucilaginibacter robiniae]|uniref:Uncharacterized protein n=1 Tax=Mucilaginibacter robiniae TaxID=2728022 RepID=A0A7L5E235_9SPHI|nr:hypothetical protein [Mucilaginibacter robiniae]QJD97101.1 hypothetical protein HH214_15105 [Mucilaginibacter robiniae]
MENENVISGATEAEVWQQLEADLTGEDIYEYDVIIKQGNKEIELYIDIDPGGGFESGSETTQFRAVLTTRPDFRFAIHDEGFTDEIGKFFGMQDALLGYPDLDKHVIVKTNNEELARQLFADAEVREVFSGLDDFDFGIHTHHVENSSNQLPFLELNIDIGVTDPADLRILYHAFYTVLQKIEGE